jgi:hypothetical protein
MTTINLSNYAIPVLVEPSILFQMLGIQSTDTKFEKTVSLDLIDEFVGDELIEPEDEDSLTISQAFRLYFRAIVPDWSETHEINTVAGVVSRYKNKKQEVITSFRANGVFIDKETGEPYFEHGSPDVYSYRVDLEFKAPNWIIPGTKLLSQAFLTEENEGQGNKVSKISYISGAVQDDDENMHSIKIWINTGLAVKDERQKDEGNVKANKLLFAAFHKKTGDFSTCMLPRLTVGDGYKTELSALMDGYFQANGFLSCVFDIIDIKKEVFTRKDGSGDFPIYSVKIDTALLPEGLTLGYPDLSKPSVKGHETSYTDARSIGWIQMRGDKFSAPWKQIEAGTLAMPSPDNRWLLHVLRKPQNVGGYPPIALWKDTTPGKVDPTVLELREATRSIALWGGKSLSEVVTVPVIAAVFDESQVQDFETDEDEIPF